MQGLHWGGIITACCNLPRCCYHHSESRMRQPHVRMWLSTRTSQSRPSCRHHRSHGVLPVVAAVHAALSSSWPCDRFACAAWSVCCWLSTPRHLLRSAGVHLPLRVHPPPAVSQSVWVGGQWVGCHARTHTRTSATYPHTAEAASCQAATTAHIRAAASTASCAAHDAGNDEQQDSAAHGAANDNVAPGELGRDTVGAR